MTEDQEATERSLDELYRRPGFLLRRAHQISVALFLEEANGLGITTTQYGAMVVPRAAASIRSGSPLWSGSTAPPPRWW